MHGIRCSASILAMGLFAQLAGATGNPSSTTASLPPVESSAQAKFHQGDAVRISVFPDTSLFLNGVYRVDEQGYIHLPLAGRLRVINKSEEDLSDFLNSTYVQHLPFPNVQVQPLVRISFLGGFYRPGLYYVDPRISLWDAVQLSGGPQREDGFKKLKWERNRSLVSNNLVPLLESGKSLREIGFRSGDQIWVTARPRQSVWDIIRADILPVATLITTTLLSSVTLYQVMRD